MSLTYLSKKKKKTCELDTLYNVGPYPLNLKPRTHLSNKLQTTKYKQNYTLASASVSVILIVCQWPQSLSEAVVLLLVAPTPSTFSHSHPTLLLVHSVPPISLYSTHRLEMPPIASCRFAASWPHLLERKSDHCWFFLAVLGSFGFVGFVCFGVLVNEF